MELKPHVVSTDLSGYITYLFGPSKIGKTTFASQTPSPLIIAFQRGYNALPGIFVQDAISWSEMKMILRELRKPEVKEKFKTIVIDTIDVAAACCEKYVLNQAGVDALNQIPYGQGWAKVKRELEDTFRAVTQLGYAVIFISHDKEKTFTREDGTSYNQTIPTLSNSYNEIIKDMVDIYAYAHLVIRDGVPTRVLTLRSLDNTVDCGTRFKYIKPEVPFNYDALVKALNEAIAEEAKHNNGKFITNEKVDTSISMEKPDYDSLMEEFNNMVKALDEKVGSAKFKEYYAPRITQIVEKYLGKGKKINNATLDQVEQVSLIVFDMRDLVAA